jgi:hypothetical protein
MIMVRAFAIALVVASSATAVATSINRPGGFVSVDNMAINADVIALVEVTAGDMRADHVPAVLYRVRVTKEVVGAIGPEACLEGPRGLRVGSRYLVFIQSSSDRGAEEQPAGCVVAGAIGDVVPRAMEIVTAASGEEFARLDNERIVYPNFSGTFPVHQNVSENGLESTLVIGSWTPLRNVLGYVVETRKRAEEE